MSDFFSNEAKTVISDIKFVIINKKCLKHGLPEAQILFIVTKEIKILKNICTNIRKYRIMYIIYRYMQRSFCGRRCGVRSYFHCVTARYRRRASAVTTLAGAVCAETAVIVFIVMFFRIFGSEDRSVSFELIAAAGISVTAGLLIYLAASLSARRKTAMHSRYTYADIQLKFAVISRYSGEMKVFGEKTVFRELYYIPFSDLVSAVPSRNGKKIVITGKVRYYGAASDSLGYHVRGGAIEFDRWWLNYGSYTELPGFEFPAVFGDPAMLCESLNAAKKRFDEIPKPKPHVFKEAEFIRRRPKHRALPDDLDYSRRWK